MVAQNAIHLKNALYVKIKILLYETRNVLLKNVIKAAKLV